ncbi:ATP-dependent helicase [Amycolatopsis decaplanina]|uniref:DNA 3'-5' helicase n=1 Tax=Amycolatopsis decaplanina DSM 44594 TaxID=1284240 RepID=M2ZAM6_9PSEU|nr:ATP-dependent DNA helicase [Amycolatopsis decaplanina]EME57414.1 ATP-dependent DNA helicase [Amycolatopsis decaplanina DSM 44594]
MAGTDARLVRTPVTGTPSFQWDSGARRLLAAPDGFRRVLGGPGTGKTALLASAASRRIAEGANPESVLILTASRKAAEVLRADITHRLTTDPEEDPLPRTIREPLVRTVHSYAYALLRMEAQAGELPPPRLLAGAEQDVVVRDLLAGDIEEGALDWPEQLRPALSVPGFAEELRDLLLRAAERGLGPEDLVELGRRRGREEWIAAGRFWSQYEEVTLLQGAGGNALGVASAPALDAAELVTSALLALEDDPELREREQRRVRHLFVDDAQHLDPLQTQLIRLIGHAADEFVVAGDPDQSVFSFRGADPRLFADADEDGERTVLLTTAHRHAPVIRTAVTKLGSVLPGSSPQRKLVDAPDAEGGAVRVRLMPTPAAEASWIADQLRRAHLVDGVPWSEMAVLVRSPARTFLVLQRALRAAGVPIGSATEELPLAKQPAVRPLLAMLRLAADPELLDVDLAEMLLSSPLGGADPLALRRLRRGLRRLELAGGGQRSSDELLVEALRTNDVLTGLAEAESLPMRRIGGLLHAAHQAVVRGDGVEQVLWDLWQASGLEQRLLRLVDRGGSLGSQADRDLDAIVALFDAAGRYVDRLPRASVASFADYLSSQNIAGDTLAPAAMKSEGVSLLTAHASAGREWTVVSIAGVQEGSWPDLRLRGSVLGVERLVDLMSGVDDEKVSATAPILAEERRLFYLAASRARKTLLVSAVAGEDEQPSRFIDDLEENGADDGGLDSRMKPAGRSLVLAELVGELREVVCDDKSGPERRQRAARQLAKLAAAGVPGAHPGTWYGLLEPSTGEPVHGPGDLIRISPSTVEVLVKCPLRWLIERHGGSDPAQLAAVTGTLVHGLAQAVAGGSSDEQIRAALDEAWVRVDAGAPWFSRRERSRVEQMLRNFISWLESSRKELIEAGVEQDIEVELPVGDDDVRVLLRGRVDRVEMDKDGRPVVIDIKTGKVPISAADAEQHPQLAAYQLAVLLGAVEGGSKPGGARLVYVAKSNNKTGSTQREQAPLDEDGGKQWLELVRSAAGSAAGPEYGVTENPDCDRCPARGCCPLRPEGRQVTGP